MVQCQRNAVPSGRNGAKAIGEFADLDIAKRAPLPATGSAVDQTKAGIDAAVLAIGKIKATITVVGEYPHIGLQFGVVRNRRNGAQSKPCLFIGRRTVHRTALPFHNRYKTIATCIASGKRNAACAQVAEDRRLGIDAFAAAIGQATRKQIAILKAVEFDDAAERTCARRHLPRTPADRNSGQIERVITRPTDPTTKRIGLWHIVENQQHAGRSISAEPAHGDPLTCRIGRACIGSPELLQTRRLLQCCFQPGTRMVGDVNARNRVGEVGPWLGQRSHDKYVRIS